MTGYDILLNSPTVIDVSGNAGGGHIAIGRNTSTNQLTNQTVIEPGVTLLADAINSGNGGLIETSGDYLQADGVNINLSSPNGTSGTWLLDPLDLTISRNGNTNVSGPSPFTPTGGSSNLNVSTLETALGSGNVTVQTTSAGTGGNGDITIETAINWANTALTISAYRNIILNGGSFTGTGTASLNLIANNAGAFANGSGNGGFAQNGGTLAVAGPVNIFSNTLTGNYASPGNTYSNTGGTLTFYMLINNASDLSTVSGNSGLWGDDFALSTNIDVGSVSPIGNSGTAFTGTFDGLDHSISNLTAGTAFASDVGLFGVSSGTIENLDVLNASVIGSQFVGAVVGNMTGGTLTNVYASGTVTIGGSSGAIGGLVGSNQGTISDSGSSVNVTGPSVATSDVGGLVGQNTGNISSSYSTGSVNSLSSFAVGGLVGLNLGNIANSYSTGATTGNTVGGLVGEDFVSGTISNSYSTGHVSGTSPGGFIGEVDSSGAVSNNFWDTSTSNQGNGVGTIGTSFGSNITNLNGGCIGCATDLSSEATYAGAGWNIGTDLSSNTWISMTGVARPILASEYSTAIATADQLQLIGLNATTEAATYTLQGNINASATASSSSIWGSAGFDPIGSFSGVFNGNNSTISNLKINDATDANVGLFGTINGGTVENVVLTNETVSGTNAGGSNTGGIAGELISGTISNAFVSGTISGTGNTGGIAGENFGTISNSENSATISGSGPSGAGGITGLNGGAISDSFNTGSVTSTTNGEAGGISGSMANGSISNSYNAGNISTQGDAGGIVGFAFNGSITDSFNIGAVQSSFASAGGLVGSGGPIITNSYWDSGTSGVTGGNTTASLMTQSTFTGWDFSNTWGIISGQSYPYLKAFYPTTPTAISGVTPAAVNQTVKLALNGTVFDTTTTGANGSFYYLEGNNVISGINNSISGTPAVLVYVDSGTVLGNIVAVIPTSGASLSGMDIPASDTVTLGSSNTTTITPAEMLAAEGSLTSDPDILYSVSGNNVSLGNATNNNVNFSTTATTTFSQSGTISNTVGSSNITFNGPLSLNSATQTLNGGTNGIISLSSIIGNGNALIIDNNNAGSTITGDITNLGALTLNGTGTLTLSGATNTITGTTDITGGTLAINNAASTTNFAGGLTGSGALTVTSGTEEVSGSNSGYNGTITMFSGTLEVNNNNTDPLGTGNLILNGGTLDALVPLTVGLANPYSINGTVTFTGANMTLLGTGIINPADSLTLNGTTITSIPALTIDNGTLDGSGTAGFIGALTLTNGSTDTIGANSGIFTVTGNINGAANLNINGPGAVDIIGNLGNSSRLLSIDSTNTAGEFTGSASTTGNQVFGAPVILSTDETYSSTGGSITFNNTINGAHNFTVNSGGTTSFNRATGNTTPLSSLTVNSSGTNINGGLVDSSGNQTYNEPVTLGAPTTIIANNVSMTHGILGNQNLTLEVVSAILDGPFAINQLITNTNTPDTTNDITIVNNTQEFWTITGAGTGTLSGITGISSPVQFNNLTNLVGGSGNNIFTLANGGSLAGSITGGSGINTLVDDNTNNIWNITGVNTGTATGIGGHFANIQNLMGGNAGNTFNFAHGGVITGTISGGALSSLNTLNFSALGSQVTVNPNLNLFSGKAFNSNGFFQSYSNINNLIANGAFSNPLNLPINIAPSFVTITGLLQGSIADPLTYSGFVVNLNFFTVSPIIQQPEIQPLAQYPTVTADYQYLDDYQNYLNGIRIDPWCYQQAAMQ